MPARADICRETDSKQRRHGKKREVCCRRCQISVTLICNVRHKNAIRAIGVANFISVGNEPSSRACADIWRLPRGALCASVTRLAPTISDDFSFAEEGCG